MTSLDLAHLVPLLLVALVMGSFATALTVRLPEGGTMLGRSRCPSCGTTLTPRDLVPLLSWLGLRGRCRHCAAPIGLLYPVLELAALAVALWAATESTGWLVWASCGLGWTLLTLSAIDLRDGVLPDVLTLPLVPAGLIVGWFAAPEGLWDDIAGAVVGYALFAFVAWAYRRWRGREGMGGGDAKLLAGIGAWVGISGLPSVVLLASLLALVAALGWRSLRGRPSLNDRVPFGPYLAAAAWVVWLYGPLVLG
jgi:leader peptidase (prepilin peptidase)/N-methyltransferase